MKLVKKVANIITYIMFGLVFAVTIFLLVVKAAGEAPSFFGCYLSYVVTDSMKPDISAGDVLLSQTTTAEELKVGDIISYKGETGDFAGKIITHQIVEIENEDGNYVITTKGTANDITDPPISERQVMSKFICKLHVLTVIFSVFNNKIGFILLIILPLCALLMSEVVSLIETIKSCREEKNNEQNCEDSKANSENNEE